MSDVCSSMGKEQRKDLQLREVMALVEKGVLPSDESRATKLVLQATVFFVIDDTLYYVDPKHGRQRRAVAPKHLRNSLLKLNDSGPLSGHLSGLRQCKALAASFWWEGMYKDAVNYCRSCPQCVTVTGGGRVGRPPLKSIPVGPETLSSYWSGHHGLAKDGGRKRTCACVPRFPLQMAHGIPNARP